MSRYGNSVRRIGETVVFGLQSIKASLKDVSEAAYDSEGRALSIKGLILKGNPEIKPGDYFIRQCAPSTAYFVESLGAEPTADDLFYMYARGCNKKISIYRANGQTTNALGDRVSDWKLKHSDVGVFYDMHNRSLKTLNDGLKDDSIYVLMLPSVYKLSVSDRVVMPATIGGALSTQNLMVNSVSNALNGVDTVQLSLDTRS